MEGSDEKGRKNHAANTASKPDSKQKPNIAKKILLGLVVLFFIFSVYSFITILTNPISKIHPFTRFNLIFEKETAIPVSADYKCLDCNIVLISIDALRADHLPCYDYSRNTAPNICRLAEKNAVLFENAFSNAISTAESHASIFTSQYFSVHRAERTAPLKDEKLTLAEVLKANNYSTAAFTGGGMLDAYYNLDQGFDTYYSSNELADKKMMNKEMDESLNWLTKWMYNNRKNKFFLFFHTYAVHTPYNPPKPYDTMYVSSEYNGKLKGLPLLDRASILTKTGNFSELSAEDIQYIIDHYDGGINYADFYINKLVENLNQLKISKKTIIFITADHGEELMDHNGIGHSYPYDEQIHVPLIIVYPYDISDLSKSKRINNFAQSIDLMPTITDILGVQIGKPVQGISLLPLIRGDENASRNGFVYAESSMGDVTRCKLVYHIYKSIFVNNDSFCDQLSYGREFLCLALFNQNKSYCDLMSNLAVFGCRRIYDDAAPVLSEKISDCSMFVNNENNRICNALHANKTYNETCPDDLDVYFTITQMIMNNNFKYFDYTDPDDPNKGALFDLVNDPAELEDVIDKYPEVAEQMRMQLQNIIEANKQYVIEEEKNWIVNVNNAVDNQEINKALLEKLKSLGYLN